MDDSAQNLLRVGDEVLIPFSEISFAASRSSGPGGQNVNKVSTRVTLLFDLEGSPSLTSGQKARLRRKLANRINREGILQVSSQQSRSQAANRETALEIFSELLRSALRRPRPRRPTRKPRAADRKRLEKKKQRGQRKRERSKVPMEGES